MMIQKIFFSLITISSVLLSAAFDVHHIITSSENTQLFTHTSTTFTPTTCMFELPVNISEGKDIQCGYLTVPSKRNQPDDKTIRLAIAIIKSVDPYPKSDPIFIAQGGPGGSTIETYINPLLSESNRIRADRDIVLFDQRGTLYSQPSLYCNEYDSFLMDHLETDLSSEEYHQLFLDVMKDCQRRLVSQGIDLSDFNSIENAYDIEALRIALGYEKINLYGVSYGTLLALHYMRLFPGSLRSVVLDGVVAPQINTILDNLENQDRAFRQFFDACTADINCNNEYPDLEKVFYDLVAKLEITPVEIYLVDPEDNRLHKAIFDGESMVSSIFQILYVSNLIPAVPKMIYAANQGDFEVLARIISFFIFDRSMSYGMYFSTWCTEDADFDPESLDNSGIHPVIAEFDGNSPKEFLDICNIWQAQPLGSIVDEPVISDTPTLLLSGVYDPVTPPSNAEIVSASLSNSFNVVFPIGSHGQMLDNACSDSIILAFLNDPNNAPDTSCISDYNRQSFYTSKTVINIPGILGLLNLDGDAATQAILLLLALIFLVTAIFFLPLIWLINLLQPKPQTKPPITVQTPYSGELLNQQSLPTSTTVDEEQNLSRPPLSTRLSSWFAVLNAIILLSFCVVVVVILFQMISANDNRLYFGLAGEYRAWFILPPLAVLFTSGMLIASIQSWKIKEWSLMRKAYYALLTVAAIIIISVLGLWNLLTAFIK